MRPEASTRRWGAAVGLSLLLHALALSWWWGGGAQALACDARCGLPSTGRPGACHGVDCHVAAVGVRGGISHAACAACRPAACNQRAHSASTQKAGRCRARLGRHGHGAACRRTASRGPTGRARAAGHGFRACQALALGGGRPAPRSRRHQCAGAPAGAHCSAPTLDSRRRKQRRSGWGHAPDRAVRRRGRAGHAGATRCGGVLRGGAFCQPAACHGCGAAHRVAAQLLLSSTGTACTVQGLLML